MPSESQASHSRYIVKSIMHASAVWGAFRSPGEVLRLQDIVCRSGLGKEMCFRLLYTLHECGFLEKVGKNQYRVAYPQGRQRRFRIGFAGEEHFSSFSHQVSDGLVRACQKAQMELIMVDNRLDPEVGIRNSEQLIREHVDLAVELQINESAASAVAAKFQNAGIPLIAVDIPHPGATYFGADNHRAGFLGGRCLGQHAMQRWEGSVDQIILLGIVQAGVMARTRVDGILDGIKKDVCTAAEKCQVVRLDGRGEFRTSMECVRKHLCGNTANHILVGAANDPSALGALRAFQECGRSAHCAVVGQGAEPVGRAEMREDGTRLIGSVAYFPERYGDAIVRIATDVLLGKTVNPATFTTHQLITPENVNRLYPNDAIFAMAGEYT
jgi:ribose transport system substrate-binding protein